MPTSPRTTPWSRRQACVALAGGLSAGCGFTLGAGRAEAQSDGAAAAPRTPAQLQALLQAQVAAQGSGLVAFEVQAGGVRFAAASRPGAPAVDERTLFEIGSITKTFTALLLADAVQRGAFTLDDAVEAVLPGGLKLRDRAGEPLRWRDLATHRSGLPRLASNMLPAQAADPYADYGWDALALFLRGWQPRRARGEAYEYSNLGFGLLGQALAFQAGTSFAGLLRQRVFAPLGLENVHLSQAGAPPRVAGHDADGRAVPAWHFTDATAGAGAIVADARALARYAQAALGLVDHPLRDAFALCLRRHADGSAPMNPTGLAWLLAPLNGRTVFNHDGGTFGFSTSLWLDPERRRAAAVLSNAAVPVNLLALHLLDEAVPPPDPQAAKAAAQQRAVPVEADAQAALAGTYALLPNFKLTVRADGTRLFGQATGQAEFELFRKAGVGTRRYFARVAPLEIEFDGERGAPPAFTLHQGGQQLRFVRE